jgi:hypothetical protein
MPPSDQHEEEKVLAALDLIRKNPGIKAAEAARITRVLYYWVIRRLNKVSRLSSQGGHNKKLDMPFIKAFKRVFFLCVTL